MHTDFSVPQRMSAGAFVIIFLKTLKSLANIFVLAIVVRLFESDGDCSFWVRLLLILAGCVVLAFVYAFLEYKFKMFYIKDGSLIFMHGVFRRETITIPLDKIHTMHT
nr:PH domain-containing protein [Paramuribaculum sp.]